MEEDERQKLLEEMGVADHQMPPEPVAATVKQVIDALSKMPPAARVYLEGCDCIGIASGVAILESDGDVLLKRGER